MSTLWMTNNSKYDGQPWPTFTAAAAATANDPFSFTNEGHLTKVIMVTWHTRRELMVYDIAGVSFWLKSEAGLKQEKDNVTKVSEPTGKSRLKNFLETAPCRDCKVW